MSASHDLLDDADFMPGTTFHYFGQFRPRQDVPGSGAVPQMLGNFLDHFIRPR
ncbi:hypothetical protein [Mycobacteroides abscessus]|uniref:hypothetical protein n=1 Tax=Mycobacteroides abscessus TaxID=36809 RepID=UPI001A975961|nr:hypothetical protein [Mycobacteroides abscessus]